MDKPPTDVDEEAILALLTRDIEMRRKAQRLAPQDLTQYIESLEASHLDKETQAATKLAKATGLPVASTTVQPSLYTFVFVHKPRPMSLHVNTNGPPHTCSDTSSKMCSI